MNKKIDWTLTIVPFLAVLVLCVFFFLAPEGSNAVLSRVRGFLGEEWGVFYLLTGLGIFLLSLYLAFSSYGGIVLGDPGEKPKYGFFSWGAMMFTAGLAADIVFYSFCEWLLYIEHPHILGLSGSSYTWSSAYTLFHWSFIPWGFYLVLAVAFGFMLHVRKRSRQRYSEACRALLGSAADGAAGRVIDLLALFALLAGTATTFSIATPLLSEAIRTLLGVSVSSRSLTIFILLVTCGVYTVTLLRGMGGVSFLANLCSFLFYGLLLYVFLFGGQCRYILESGVTAMGVLVENFFSMATYTDPLRETHFPQDWTIFYWAYWMVWCVAAPFFIGEISRGRRVKDVILGGYVFGVGSTILSFLVLGNYSMGLQLSGKLDILGAYHRLGSLYETIIYMLQGLPLFPLVLLLLIVTMIAFYATSFGSIALVASQYSYRKLEPGEESSRGMRAFWAVLLILLPLVLVFSESSMMNLQSVSIIAAFPIAFVMLLIIGSFLKDGGQYLREANPSMGTLGANPGEPSLPEGKAEEKALREAKFHEDPMSDESIDLLLENWESSYGDR